MIVFDTFASSRIHVMSRTGQDKEASDIYSTLNIKKTCDRHLEDDAGRRRRVEVLLQHIETMPIEW